MHIPVIHLPLFGRPSLSHFVSSTLLFNTSFLHLPWIGYQIGPKKIKDIIFSFQQMVILTFYKCWLSTSRGIMQILYELCYVQRKLFSSLLPIFKSWYLYILAINIELAINIKLKMIYHYHYPIEMMSLPRCVHDFKSFYMRKSYGNKVVHKM